MKREAEGTFWAGRGSPWQFPQRRKSCTTLSAPHRPELLSSGSHRGLSAAVIRSHAFCPIFARAKQTYPPGDTTKTNSRVKDSLVLHLALPKLGCVITGFLHLLVPASARVKISVLRVYCVAQLLAVKVFRETGEGNLSYSIGNSNLSQIFSSAAQHHPH